MFPRVSLLYRFVALCLFLCVLIMVLNTHSDLTTHKRLPYLDERSLREQLTEPLVSRPNWASNVTTPHPKTTTPDPGPVVNPHDFQYVYNPVKMCNVAGLKYVIFVHSAPRNYKKRQMVRQTWGSKAVQSKYNMRLVFVMGMTSDKTITEAVALENEHYSDIVLEDFMDSYRNLTYKAIAGLKWVSTYCPNTTYVIKSDDDILIDMHSLMDYMNSSVVRGYGTKSLVMCNQWTRMKVIRDKKSKWYISKQEFPDEFFPPYCSGSAFVMSVDVARAMFRASLYTKFFWVDDFYVTGLLVKKINVEHRRLNDGYILNAKVALDRLHEDTDKHLKFFHVNKLSQIYRMWKMVKERTNLTCDDCGTWSPDDVKPT